MINMEKIGIVAVSNHNYGSLLQTYAIQKHLDTFGIDNEIIAYKSNSSKQLYRNFQKSTN